jgi:hypothetical protein
MIPIVLKETENIIAVVPESCSGPGWTNNVVWVYIADVSHTVRYVCLQWEDYYDSPIATLFQVGDVLNKQLKSLIPVKRVRNG